MNVTALIGAAISSGKVSLRDLDEYYSLEDVYDVLEIVSVDAHNEGVMRKKAETHHG